MSKKWTAVNTNELIEKYKTFEVLWKTTEKASGDRNKKHEKLKQLSVHFSCSENEIKRKLHNLRNQMSQELRKIKIRKSGVGTEEEYSSKWPYFRGLQFLIPFLTAPSRKSNVVLTQEKQRQEKPNMQSTSKTETTSELLQPVEIIENNKSDGRAKKRRRDSVDDVIETALNILKKEPDEYDTFGEYVALELRSLRFDFNKRKLKSEIRKAIVRIADDDDSLSQSSTSIYQSTKNDNFISSVSNEYTL